MYSDDERDYAEEAWQRDYSDEKREAPGMTPQELVDAGRQAVADWNDGRSAGPAGQALRDAVVGLLDLRAKDTDHIADLVGQVDAALAERDRLLVALRMAGAAQADRAMLRVEVEGLRRELVETRAERDRLTGEVAGWRNVAKEEERRRDGLFAAIERVTALLSVEIGDGRVDLHESKKVTVGALRKALYGVTVAEARAALHGGGQ